jgi:serine/threonine protein kinase
MRGDCSAPVS